MTEPETATPPYVVEGRPGPGLATIVDRRDGTTGLWSRTLRQGSHGPASKRAEACANCGGALAGGGFYKPPTSPRRSRDRLCVACVEGDYE